MTVKRNTSLLGLFFLAATLSLFANAGNALANSPPGITNVISTKNVIIVSGVSTGGVLRILELQPYETSATASTAVVARVTQQASFAVSVPRFDGVRDRLYSSFFAIREGGGELFPMGTNRFVEELHGVSLNPEPFPKCASKKGLQIQMMDDALALGVKHAAFNVNLGSLIDLKGQQNSAPWSMDGQDYFFNRSYLDWLDRQVKMISESGGVASLILLYYKSSQPELNKIMLHPQFDPKAPNGLTAFNTATPEGLRYFKACLEFLAARYSQTDHRYGRAANFIVGNEINSHWFWYNMGRVSMETLAEDYLRTVRVCNTAVRKFSASSRVYLSLEHHWNIRYPGGDERQAFAGRKFLDYFNRRAQEQGDLEWHLAFHPYPENLGNPRTWNDKSATLSENTPRITFKNLEMLTQYLRRPELLYRGQPRRAILSEQGFHTMDGANGELWQAAAFAYAFYRAANLPGIDAFIYHRHVDHKAEGGLRLGLWRRNETVPSASEPGAKKQIYEVFRHADLPDWEKSFEFALPVLGIKSWEEIRPQTPPAE